MTRHSINCIFLGRMMICWIEFVDKGGKLGKGVSDLSL